MQGALLPVYCILLAALTAAAGGLDDERGPVPGPDTSCIYLPLLRTVGWWCCANRTLSLEDGALVGRRWGTGHCERAMALAAQAKATPRPVAERQRLVSDVLFFSLLLSICVALVVGVCVWIYEWTQKRLAQRRLHRIRVSRGCNTATSAGTTLSAYALLDLPPRAPAPDNTLSI